MTFYVSVGHMLSTLDVVVFIDPVAVGGTAVAAPLPFRPGNSALCGSCHPTLL